MFLSEIRKRGWTSVYSSGKAPHDDQVRGSFHLYSYHPKEISKVWRKISKLTRRDKLGYMSSISEDVMFGGNFEGAHTISVHTLDKESRKVRTVLRRANLSQYIFKYNLIKKFRYGQCADDDEYVSSEYEEDEEIGEEEEEEEEQSESEPEEQSSDDDDDEETAPPPKMNRRMVEVTLKIRKEIQLVVKMKKKRSTMRRRRSVE